MSASSRSIEEAGTLSSAPYDANTTDRAKRSEGMGGGVTVFVLSTQDVAIVSLLHAASRSSRGGLSQAQHARGALASSHRRFTAVN